MSQNNNKSNNKKKIFISLFVVGVLLAGILGFVFIYDVGGNNPVNPQPEPEPKEPANNGSPLGEKYIIINNSDDKHYDTITAAVKNEDPQENGKYYFDVQATGKPYPADGIGYKYSVNSAGGDPSETPQRTDWVSKSYTEKYKYKVPPLVIKSSSEKRPHFKITQKYVGVYLRPGDSINRINLSSEYKTFGFFIKRATPEYTNETITINNVNINSVYDSIISEYTTNNINIHNVTVTTKAGIKLSGNNISLTNVNINTSKDLKSLPENIARGGYLVIEGKRNITVKNVTVDGRTEITGIKYTASYVTPDNSYNAIVDGYSFGQGMVVSDLHNSTIQNITIKGASVDLGVGENTTIDTVHFSDNLKELDIYGGSGKLYNIQMTKSNPNADVIFDLYDAETIEVNNSSFKYNNTMYEDVTFKKYESTSKVKELGYPLTETHSKKYTTYKGGIGKVHNYPYLPPHKIYKGELQQKPDKILKK